MCIQKIYEKYPGLPFSKHPEKYVKFTPAERLIFGGFFNPWDEEIPIPETRPIRKSYNHKLAIPGISFEREAFDIFLHNFLHKPAELFE